MLKSSKQGRIGAKESVARPENIWDHLLERFNTKRKGPLNINRNNKPARESVYNPW